MSAIARQQKTKGDTFAQQAEAELSKKSWFASKEKKYEDACELYQSAGNAYKVGGFYFEAGQAYYKAAIMFRDNLKNAFDASKAFQNAGKGKEGRSSWY
jgi:alpha-soluble NSF attachment protein